VQCCLRSVISKLLVSDIDATKRFFEFWANAAITGMLSCAYESDLALAEFFRDGQGPEVAMAVVDGGFAMGSNLPLFAKGETDGFEGGEAVTTSTGETKVIPKKANFGTLSSGGLY
jgi:penicillin-binding protein 1A